MEAFQSLLFWFFIIVPFILFIIALIRTSWVLIIVSLLFALPIVFFVSWITDQYGAFFIVILLHLIAGIWLWMKQQRIK